MRGVGVYQDEEFMGEIEIPEAQALAHLHKLKVLHLENLVMDAGCMASMALMDQRKLSLANAYVPNVRAVLAGALSRMDHMEELTLDLRNVTSTFDDILANDGGTSWRRRWRRCCRRWRTSRFWDSLGTRN